MRHTLGAVVAALAVCACSGSEGQPDESLGGLVKAESTAPQPVDVDRAGDAPDELLRSMQLPHSFVSDKLGSHTFAGTSSLAVTQAGKLIDGVDYETVVEFASPTEYHAVANNNQDYGREVFYAGGNMYLRARYGKYHKRPPADEDEPARVRSEIFATLGAYFEPLAAGAELTDRGAVTHAGRDARKIEIKTAPTQREMPAQKLTQRKWREQATVRSVSGEVLIDAEYGVPLQAEIEGVLVYSQDGTPSEMAIKVSYAISDIGGAVTITPPAADKTVDTPTRLEEVDERDELLEGIAPPAAKGPTPKNPSGSSQPTKSGAQK